MTTYTAARIPYAALPVAKISDVLGELQRIQRQQSGMFQPRRLVHGMDASAYVVRSTDWLILADMTAGAFTLTFPDAARLDGLEITVVKIDSSANAVTLSATINGAVNPTLATQFASRIVQAGQGVWYSTPRFSAADITPGTFPSGTFVFPGTLDLSSATLILPTGTWTPLLKGSSADPTSVVYGGARGGVWTKVGNRVLIQGFLVTTSFTGGTGNVQFGGLPFPTKTDGSGNGGFAALLGGDYSLSLPTNTYGVALEPAANGGSLFNIFSNGNTGISQLTFSNWGNATTQFLYVNGQYQIA